MLFSITQQQMGYLLGMSTKSLSVRGIDISYLTRNPKKALALNSPTIVLFHGATVNKHSWISLVWFLPISWRIIAIDLPGHGDSGFKDTEKYSPYEVEGLLHEVRYVLVVYVWCKFGPR